jgi:hypothetical protein
MTDGLPNVALDILKNKIQDIVIERFGKLYLRHRAIAAYLIDEHVKRELLKEAYIRILRSLSINIKGRHWRDSKSGLYRSLIIGLCPITHDEINNLYGYLNRPVVAVECLLSNSGRHIQNTNDYDLSQRRKYPNILECQKVKSVHGYNYSRKELSTGCCIFVSYTSL